MTIVGPGNNEPLKKTETAQSISAQANIGSSTTVGERKAESIDAKVAAVPNGNQGASIFHGIVSFV